jgi:hypothetical protein
LASALKETASRRPRRFVVRVVPSLADVDLVYQDFNVDSGRLAPAGAL